LLLRGLEGASLGTKGAIMAGDWIKVRTNLYSDNRVTMLSLATKAEQAATFGRLIRYFCWLSEYTDNGEIMPMSAEALDRLVECEGFCQGLIDVGWLEPLEKDGRKGFRVINWDEHNSGSAKRRAREALRKFERYHADKKRRSSGEGGENRRRRSIEEGEKRPTHSYSYSKKREESEERETNPYATLAMSMFRKKLSELTDDEKRQVVLAHSSQGKVVT